MQRSYGAAFQRLRARDLFDLYLFSGRPFDRDIVRKLVVVKCWNVREPFNPDALLSSISEGKYDWDDLQRLVRRGDLDGNLLRIVNDSKAHKEKNWLRRFLEKGRLLISAVADISVTLEI